VAVSYTGRWKESAGLGNAAAYTAPMARMLYLRDIEVDVHVRCRTCGHEGVLPRADMHRRFGPNYPVLSIAPHYRCSKCNSRDTESRPAPPPLSLVGGTEVDAPDAPPSFAGPLAALQGLLDAVRGRGDADDADDAPPALREPAFRDSTARGPANEDWVPAPPREERERPRPLRLDELIADGPATPEAGRRPLWEPVSLADMAGHSGEEPAEDDPAHENEPDARPRTAAPDPRDEDADDGLSPFERTIAALRNLVDADGVAEAKPAARPFQEDDQSEDDEPEDNEPPPVFSVNVLVRTDFDDDEDLEEDERDDDVLNDVDFGNFHDRHADESADEEIADDEIDGDPSDDEIVAFAIRDPDKAPPRRERPPATEEPPLDKTIAALRDMVREAAADPDDPDDDPVVTRFARSRTPVFAPDPEENSEPDQDLSVRNLPVPNLEPEPEEEFDALTLSDEIGDDEGQDEDDTPRLRKSAQELEMEEALRALRALVEQEDDEHGDERDDDRQDDASQDDDEPEEPTPVPVRAGRPAATVPFDEDDGLPTMRKLTGGVPSAPAPAWDLDHDLDKDPDAEDEPFNLVGKLVREAERSGAKVSVEPKATDPGTPDPQPSAAKAKGEPSSLDKTIAALRSMLELDGKRGR